MRKTFTPANLEKPVTFKVAVNKARDLFGDPKPSAKDLLEKGVVTQDAEHNGGNGLWYVDPKNTSVKKLLKEKETTAA